MSTRCALQKGNGEQNISWVSDVYWVSTRWALGEYWQLCLIRCALGQYCTCLEVCTRWALNLDNLCRWILGEYSGFTIFMTVCTEWAFHLQLLAKNDWTKRSKLCDQMGLDKITSKWMANLYLCRWKINQNESNYSFHLLVQPLEIHTTQDFV